MAKQHTLISKPLASRTFVKAASLIKDGSLDAKREQRNLKANHHKKYTPVISLRKLDGFWNPEGKRKAKGSGVKCDTINRVMRAQQ